jgi:class 3 adenylate cyclase
MDVPPIRRRLAAILAADVSGYSRLMAADEETTLRTLDALDLEAPASSDVRPPALRSNSRRF